MAEMQASPGDCVKCGVNYQGHARHLEQVRLQNEQARALQASLSPVVREVSAAYQGAQPVVVVDVRMSFWSMVVFMVKWVIASIPAGLILLALGSFIYGVVTALPAYMPASSGPPPLAPAAQSEPKRIIMPASMRGEFYEIGLARSDNFAVMAVKTVMPDGEVAFSRVSFNCANATAAIVAFARTLEGLGPTSGPGSYEQITAGTPRQYIAKHACMQMPVRHVLLQ
ncbi:hypothetical protein [Pseudomonas sp.]|uniref:hypothetical protein n=1 Tax=Pseudomonas sp. TaxID=306 RepID=UPI00272EF122|nr:hypothetical protein [Pseudomonas sp.]MDP2446591.1 hypothetical protein [Pseudomonas sp.]MDZ4334277.1 hypothetical protein [Pseudomonas sp.]